MDLNTVIQKVTRQLHQDGITTSPTVDGIKIAIIDAMRFMRSQPFFFNTRRYTVNTTANDYSVPLPEDFMSLDGNVYFLRSGSPSARTILRPETVDFVETYKDSLMDYPRTLRYTGYPIAYAISEEQDYRRMLIAPTPDTSDHSVYFRYVFDVGCPRYQYNGSTYSFYLPKTDDSLTGTWTNPFLQHALDMIAYRAVYDLWSGIYGGTDEAQNKASIALGRWTEEISRLRKERSRSRQGISVRKYI